MTKGIRLSEKYGVNPSMGQCSYCGGDDGTIALFGRLKNDAEAPRRAVVSKEPCPTCKGWMREGVMLVSVRDGETGENPYRTGRMAVVKDAAIARLVTSPDLVADILKKRLAFIPDAVWFALGLPLADGQQ